MDSRTQTVEINHDKLCRYIRDTLHMTLIDFSYSIGKSKSYISGLARNPRVPGAAYSLICEKCRVPFSYFEAVPQEERQKSQEQTSVNPELLLMLKSLSDSMFEQGKKLHLEPHFCYEYLGRCSCMACMFMSDTHAIENMKRYPEKIKPFIDAEIRLSHTWKRNKGLAELWEQCKDIDDVEDMPEVLP